MFEADCIKIILAQNDRDKGIDHLVGTMNDTYAFVYETEPLRKIESHERIIVLIMQQTTECGYFIRDYAKKKEFCTWDLLYVKRRYLIMIFVRGENPEASCVGC